MINKILLLGAFALSNAITPCLAESNTTIVLQEQEETEPESCSVMYVGKNASSTGEAIIARSADAGPKAMNLNMQIFAHNELANKTVTGNNGFEWKMPSETYRYISTPRNPNIKKGNHWEVSGINENGVGVTATLSCYANADAKAADDFVDAGISEDNITQIASAVATSAKAGIEYIAKIIDEKGSQDANIILLIDQNEAWLMEMYTGHQYFAMKLPDDKVCTIGNEFFLETFAELNLKEGEYIHSKELFTLPVEKGFAKYDGGSDWQHLDLFDTYARSLISEDEEARVDSDGCHRRTWIGNCLFAPESAAAQSYGSETKYKPFIEPERKLGIQDVISYMRDRFETIMEYDSDEKVYYFPEKYQYFQQDYENNCLRRVGYETAYQIHIIQSHAYLDPSIACEEWVCLSNSNYAPFVPISNGVTNMNELYTHQSQTYGYDENSAVSIYKRLNRLAAIDRINYGLPVQHLLEHYEGIWNQQYRQVLNQIKDVSVKKAKNVLTNFTMHIQEQALALSDQIFNRLLWHAATDYGSWDTTTTEFIPLVDLKEFSSLYDWKYTIKDKIVTLTHGNDIVTVDTNYDFFNPGKVTGKDGNKQDITVYVDTNNKVYVGFDVIKQHIADGYLLKKININDYYDNDLVWIIPVAVCVPVGVAAAITIPLVVYKKKKKQTIKQK